MSREYIRSTSILGILPVAGSVVFTDGFEDLLNWTQGGGGGDDIFELDPTLAKMGKHSLHLKTRTIDAAAEDEIFATRYTHLLPSKILTFISSFRYANVGRIKQINFQFRFRDGTNEHSAIVIYTPSTPKWTYYDDTPADVVIPSLAFTLAEETWHTLILKVNFATSKYISLQVDHLLADLSAFSIRSAPNGNPIRLENNFAVTAVGANPADLSIDDVLIHEH